MNSGYLTYHPERQRKEFGQTVVHFDICNGNQDPYVWNVQFLHTFCHITEMSPDPGDICFWVWRPKTNPVQLFCDLVFVVESKIGWQNANKISRRDRIVDSKEAWNDHYHWGNLQKGEPHYFKKQKRFTLKADPKRSFQPQHANGELIDIAPFLRKHGFTTKALLNKGARPFRINHVVESLYNWICQKADTKLTGAKLQAIRAKNLSLASPVGRCEGCC